jgi:hypothetical protein
MPAVVTTLLDSRLLDTERCRVSCCVVVQELHPDVVSFLRQKRAEMRDIIETKFQVTLSLAAIDAQLLYAEPSHWVFIVSGYRPYLITHAKQGEGCLRRRWENTRLEGSDRDAAMGQRWSGPVQRSKCDWAGIRSPCLMCPSIR